MISKMITHTLILVLAASLCRTHEDVDVPLTQMYGGPPLPVQTQGQPGYPPGGQPGYPPGGQPGYPPVLYSGVRPIGGCPGQYPPGLFPGGQNGFATQGGLGPSYTGGAFPNQPLNGGEVIVTGNPQYQFPYYPQPGTPIYQINGQTYVPNIQYGTNTQQTGGAYNVPPCTKTLLEAGVGDKSRAATSNNDFPQPAYGIADDQDKNPTENILGGLYLAPYRPNCDKSSGRSSENEDTVPLQLYETRSADSPILTAVNVLHPNFARGLDNYFHRFGFTKPLPHGGLIYSNTFSNHLHSNFH